MWVCISVSVWTRFSNAIIKRTFWPTHTTFSVKVRIRFGVRHFVMVVKAKVGA